MTTKDQTLQPLMRSADAGLRQRLRQWWKPGAATRKPPKTIALFGLFGCGNLGNDGSLETMLEFLRQARPEASLYCICHDPELVSETFSIPTVPMSWSSQTAGWAPRPIRLALKFVGKLTDVVQTFRHIRKADVMIVPGTGILDDFGERAWGMPFNIFRWCVAARIVGTKIALVSIGAGPIGTDPSRWLMKSAARFAHYRSYRDIMSKEFMEGIGFDTRRDPIYPDIVFRLATPPIPPSRKDAGPLTVGIGVMSYYGWYGFAEGGQAIFETYIGKLAEFATQLLDQGHDLRLFTGELGDQGAVDRLLRKLIADRPDAAHRITAEPAFSLHDVMRQMAPVDVVVATRFHNIVCALKMGKPTISLGYSRKNDMLMSEMGLADFCQHVERFDVGTLSQHFSSLTAQRRDHEVAIRNRVRQFGEMLEEQEAVLLARLI
jgi:polysaccharide pyruvyl transferase WcaK-like protein